MSEESELAAKHSKRKSTHCINKVAAERGKAAYTKLRLLEILDLQARHSGTLFKSQESGPEN